MSDSGASKRLVAIFCADVEGYTRLTATDEIGTLRLLNRFRELTEKLIRRNGGRIANTAGDSVLAEFHSANQALTAAIDILERLSSVNNDLPNARRMEFRVGIHVGEVIVEDGDLFGDDVNIAARLQQMAQPGTVYLSRLAHHFARRASDLEFVDLGPLQGKNLADPVHAFKVQPIPDASPTAVPAIHRRSEAHLARRFHELCHDALSRATNTEGLSPVDFATLISTHDAQGIDAKLLSHRTGVDRERISETVGKLVDRGLIEPSTKRKSWMCGSLRLTAKGEEVLLPLIPKVLAAQDRVLAVLSDNEREILRQLLARVVLAESKGSD